MMDLEGWIEKIDRTRSIRVFPYMSLMVYCSSLFVCETVRKNKRSNTMTWIESLCLCFLGQFGGTTIASILIGEPIHFLTSDAMVVGVICAWLTIFCSPFDWGLKLFEMLPIRFICRIFQLLGVAFSITVYGVDHVFKSDHPRALKSLSMLIVTGTISGCGGCVILDYYHFYQDQLSKKKEDEEGNELVKEKSHLIDYLIRPTFYVKRAFFASLIYIYLMDPFSSIRGYALYDEKRCHIVIIGFIMLTTVLNKYGVNVLDVISILFHKLTRIPKEIPLFGRRWSYEEIYELNKDE